jgi:hypothetical protein
MGDKEEALMKFGFSLLSAHLLPQVGEAQTNPGYTKKA